MIAVIPAAGMGKRFAEAGFYNPKPLLSLEDGRPMIQRIRRSIGDVETIIIARRADTKAMQPRVIIEDFIHAHPRMVYLDKASAGPLDTVLRVRKWLKIHDELLINYCDCWLTPNIEGFVGWCREIAAEAGMVTFPSTDARFSHTEDGTAIGGVFYFREACEFVRRARRIAKTESSDVGIPTVVLDCDRPVLYTAYARYVDLGSPEDYKRYMAWRSYLPGGR